jgi:isoleucyl-tRNA synthetase
MSKSKGNIVEPFAVIEKYGVDAVRWYLYTNSPLGEPKNFDEADIQKMFRRVHLIVYNSLIFWRTYAKKSEAKGKEHGAKGMNVLDAWILARLNETIHEATKQLERYEIRDAAIAIETLVDDLSRWYIRRSRRRLQKPESKTDYEAASATLGYVLRETAKLIAPFVPFFAESIYQGLGEKESVHLEGWPMVGKWQSAKSTGLIKDMAEVRRLASVGLAMRADAKIKVRQPLASMRIPRGCGLADKKEFLAVLADEVNVKEIRFDPPLKDGVDLDLNITPELKAEGTLRELVRMAQELRQNAGLQPKDGIVLMMEASSIRAVVQKNEQFLKGEVGAKTVEYKKGKFTAEIATKLDGEDIWLAVRRA